MSIFTVIFIKNQIIVCVDIKVVAKYDAKYLFWTLGTCETSETYIIGKLVQENDCCLAPGNHTLTCYNTRKPHGWKQGFIVINGERYCDDFIGYKAMRRVIINGNISHFETLVLVSSQITPRKKLLLMKKIVLGSSNGEFDEKFLASFNITSDGTYILMPFLA